MNKDALKKNKEAAGPGGMEGEEVNQQIKAVNLPACDSGDPGHVSAGHSMAVGLPHPSPHSP